jgi:hypothetical protein
MRWEGVGEVPLSQDRDQWWAVVNTVMNLQVAKYPGHNITGKLWLAFAKGRVWEAMKLEPQRGIRDLGGRDGCTGEAAALETSNRPRRQVCTNQQQVT